MQLHGNAKTTPYTRELMVRRVLEQAEPVRDTAESFGVSPQTVYKWLRRYRALGPLERGYRNHTGLRGLHRRRTGQQPAIGELGR